MTGRIVRAPDRRRFLVIDKQTTEDSSLSFRARGLLVWILSKPDDWNVHIDSLHKHAKEGRDACRKAFAELVEAGYVVKTAIPASPGVPPGYDYTVQELPTDAENPRRTDAGNPTRETRALKTRVLKSTQGKEDTEKENTHELVFDDAWDAYGKIGVRKTAKAKWERLTVSEKQKAMEAIPAYVDATNTNGEFPSRAHMTTWLNQERWNDAPPCTEGVSNKSSNKGQEVVEEKSSYQKHLDAAERLRQWAAENPDDCQY